MSGSGYLLLAGVALCGLALSGAVAAESPGVVTAAGVTLKSVSFSYPSSDREFPGGSAADVVTSNCTACHSPGMVLTQPAMTQAGWQEEVNKMRNTYKAPIAEEDVPSIVSYLAGIRGAR